MNKSELIQAISEKADLNKAMAEKALNSLVEVISDELAKGETVALVGFGTFQVSERAARKGRNPQTGQEIDIAASKNPTFKPGKGLKDAVNS
ncbi:MULTISPECIES: HU family DNA-binding protein [Pseudomonas]|uniref:DNA-binding protein HU-beta n=2 Tax=Pseudomonas TaxID=286 RepID=A0A2X2CDC1_PSELU|nr:MULTISPECIES: HU family DNA-binding protein [Pseudomonas]SER42152.1 DNA-binding protein HU-beta [Pseudomonas lutea]SPZ05133.1 DNA-binding protein HU [Pseudomonas luteola]